MSNPFFWTQEEAIALCTSLEPIAAKYGGHVALTGGTLYKDGPRKDVDVLIYRSLDEPAFNWWAFFIEIGELFGIAQGIDYGWCKKATTMAGRCIDFFDPHASGAHMSAQSPGCPKGGDQSIPQSVVKKIPQNRDEPVHG